MKLALALLLAVGGGRIALGGGWRVLPRGGPPGCHHFAAAWSGKEIFFYCDRQLGKLDPEEGKIGAYDPETGNWRLLANPTPVPFAESVSAAFWVKDRFIAVTNVGRARVYLPGSDLWFDVPPRAIYVDSLVAAEDG